MLDNLHRTTETGEKHRKGGSGQTLVEFALVIPVVILLFMAVIELALGFNAFVGVNRASQHAAHLASILGPEFGADCLILTQIEEDVAPPNRRGAIVQVLIQRTSLSGQYPQEQQRWERTGSSTCTLPNLDEVTIPYVLTVDDYPEKYRCSTLDGCSWPDVEDRSTVDNIAVGITYRHDWTTPLAAVITSLPGGKLGWRFTQRNIFRIEPTL